MSLTTDDLKQIRLVVCEEVDVILGRRLKPLEDRLESLENDVKEIYFMIARFERGVITDKNFKKLSLEDKLLRINVELIAAAKQAGVTLPR